MKYHNYTVFDFLKDDDFLDWMKNPTPEKNFYWESWIQNHPSKKEILLQAKEFYHSIGFKPIAISKEETEDIFQNIICAKRPTSLRFIKSTQEKNIFHYINYGIVASLLLFCLLGTIWWNTKCKENNQQQQIALQEKIIPKGQKYTIKLSDGTVVKLNAESKFSFPSTFSGNTRKVYLQGEAFFEVAKDEKKPFIIQTKRVETKVLGTSFNIKAYPTDMEEVISVATGKVMVRSRAHNTIDTLYLLPNQEALLSNESDTLKKQAFDVFEKLSWKEGIIYFKDADFEEIRTKLERWYGVEISHQLSKQIKKGYTGEYKNQPLTNVLEALSFSLEFQYKIKNNNVFIYN
ncbi:MAG: FecR domain-containing protein [Bacteroidota bacterium]